jgi:hypothetical protein
LENVTIVLFDHQVGCTPMISFCSYCLFKIPIRTLIKKVRLERNFVYDI